MIARRMGMVLAAATLAGSGTYVFVYLYRWEWNRAIIAGVFFLAAEMAVTTALVLARIRALEAAHGPAPGAAPPEVLARLRESAPPPRDHFAWLRPQSDRLGVFVPILMGAGFVLSGLAWIVERLARSTATPRLERRLAAGLAAMSLPPGHLLARDDFEDVALLLGPDRRARR